MNRQAILEGLTTIANEWPRLAIAWHAVLVVLVARLAIGPPPPRRTVALVLASSMLSVGALAWWSGNPFNGTMFTGLGLWLLRLAIDLRGATIIASSRATVAGGAGLAVFGLVYPHFLAAASPLAYLYRSPVGLIPCPTLSFAAGVTLIAAGFQCRWWTAALAGMGLVYGLVGVFALRVTIDTALVAGALFLAATAVRRGSSFATR